MSDSLQAFIQCLRYAEKNLSAGVGLGPGVEEIADMLWLAEKLPGPNAETDHHDDDDQQTPLETSPSPIEVEEVQSGVNEESSDEPSDTEETQSAELIGTLATHAERSEQASTTQAKPLTIPAASALRHPLKVARSLRALARKTESRTQKIIDEEATAIAIAEKNPVGIVQRPAQEKWLELELIIEYSRAAAIWERTSKEFVELLECLGAFRTVRVWTLEIREDNNGSPLPVLTSGRRSPDGKTNRFGKPKELIDPTGQRLVMLLSDCISPLWREGLIHGWLADWAKNGPTVIVQCFPEEYWSRTGLKCGNEVWLSAVNPGTPSNRLTRHYMGINPEDWSDSFEETSVKSKSVAIPVVSLEHESLRKWSRVVAGCGGSYVRGRRFELSWDGAQWRGPERKPKQLPSSAAEKVRLFFETASGMARELAGLMSLGPVSPEITNLIQETLLPGSETVHVAEVFLSGLLETTDNGAYQFVPGVKDLLRKAMLKVDEKLVFQVLSRYISDRYGQTPQEFTAFLQKHSDWSEEQWNELEGFAELRQHLQVESIKSISERKLDEHSQEGSRSEDKVGDLREELKSALTITDEQERTETLANLKGQSTEVLSNLLQSLSTIENETELVSYLISLIPHLPGTLLPKALEIVRTIQNTYSRFQGLTAVSALLPEVLPEALQTAQAIESEEHRAAGLITLIDKTPSEFLPQALDITQTTQDEKFRAEVLRALVNKLPPELLPQALDITQTIQDGVSRAATLKVLADTLPIELLPQAQKIAQAIEDEEYQSSTLATLANKWPKEQETGSEEIVNDVAGSGDETLSRKLNTPFGIPQSHPPIQQRPKISRRRDFYLKRLAQSEEELAAVEADFEAAPNASARINLERIAEKLLNRIEELEANLEELDSVSTNYNVRSRGLEKALQKINFVEAKKIAASIKEKLSREGGAVLFFLQKSKRQMGRYCIEEVLNVIMSDQIVEGKIVGAYRRYSIDLDSAVSQYNEIEFLHRLASYFKIDELRDSNILSQKLREKICASIDDGTTIFLEINSLDDLLDQENFLKWFIQEFWKPLIEMVATVSQRYKSKLIVALIANSQILPEHPQEYFCDAQAFDCYKMLELPLPDWSVDDIHDWLIRFRFLSSSMQKKTNSQLKRDAKRIYKETDGTPQNVCASLRERFL